MNEIVNSVPGELTRPDDVESRIFRAMIVAIAVAGWAPAGAGSLPDYPELFDPFSVPKIYMELTEADWDTTDSIVSAYRPMLDGIFEVRNLRQLGEAIYRIT